MKYKGTVHKFGDNVNTDDIIPARYLNMKTPHELAKHCMEDSDRKFAENVKNSDIIVAGRNFGCGSSREHAPIAIKACGVSCVIAKSFARIFNRNAINIGLAVFESEEAAVRIKAKDKIEVDTRKGIIKNLTRKETYKTEPFPVFLERIIEKGGLLNAIRPSKNRT